MSYLNLIQGQAPAVCYLSCMDRMHGPVLFPALENMGPFIYYQTVGAFLVMRVLRFIAD